MTTQALISAFIAKWGPKGAGFKLNEEQGAQQHFIELCAILGVPTPSGGDDYLFEKGMFQVGQRRGYADVFKRGHFAWENKAPGRSLEAALSQLMQYAFALENPPLLIVSDRLQIQIHTHFNGTPSETHTVTLAQLTDPAKRDLLRRCFVDVESFRPIFTNREITEEAANAFAGMADRMRTAGIAPAVVSHLLTQCLFCFFAEDVKLLPTKLFERLVKNKDASPEGLREGLTELFLKMQKGGRFGVDSIAWFNGGLFETINVPELHAEDVEALRAAASLNWSSIDPSIFGTLFERGLDPKKRGQLGAHYTDPATIMRLIEPVIQRPLLAEWALLKTNIQASLAKRDELRAEAATIPSTTKALREKFARVRTSANTAEREAEDAYKGFLKRLESFRILDPACGSGNFLYLALKTLKDLELQVNIEAEALGLQRQVDAYTSPANVLGIELNEYAAELARVTVWIGELQWRIQHGYPFKLNPVLDPLDQIECRDALVNEDGTEADWPDVNVVVGNPPFLGTKRQFGELGVEYSTRLRAVYAGRVPGFADLVCYWFEKARYQIEHRGMEAAGLVSTNSIRGGANREVLDRIADSATIFDAWADLEWVNEGAAVRVSLISFASKTSRHDVRLDGKGVIAINPDITSGIDLTSAAKLSENFNAGFVATVKAGTFEVSGDVARQWLALPNPNGRPNSDVVKRWANGLDLTRRWSDSWIIDFGVDMPEAEAAMFEAPFAHVLEHVKPVRAKTRGDRERRLWWLMARPIPAMRVALAGLPRYIATTIHSKHRIFTWLDASVLPDHALFVVARADDMTLGLLQSRFHLLWATRLGTSLEDRPRYTPTTCFETFPFPEGLCPADTASKVTEVGPLGTIVPSHLSTGALVHAVAIGVAAKAIYDARERWTNPPEWTQRVPDVTPLGLVASPYPDRVVALDGFRAQLAQRTLTNLYNLKPAWLTAAHQTLDAAVAAAYGWTDYTPDMADEEIVRRLLVLNAHRAGA